jgi:indolepyruvate decarboxylase
VESSDAILAIGLKLTDFNSGGFSTRFPEETTVFAWLDHTTIGKTCHERVDLSEFLTGLTPKLQTRKPGSIPYMPAHAQQEYRAALRFKHQPSKRLTIQRFFERMTSYMGKDMVMIAETGTALFAGAAMTFQKGAQLMTQTFYGSIGYTVGATLGVALGAPKKRVVLVVGDGSFQLTAQEVSTMIRYGLDPIIFVINNDGYLVERVIGDGSFNDLQQWNYAQVPQAFGGGWGCKVKTEGELESALQRAIKQKGVSLIELIIDKWDSPPAMTSAGAAMARTNYLV